MAKVTLTFTDNDDGTLGIVLDSDPPLPGPASDEDGTFAQKAAVHCMTSLQQTLSGHGHGDCDDEDCE